MNNLTFTPEQRLLHHLVLHSNDAPVRGLMDGQMGIVLVLSEYIRLRKLRPLRTAVNFLLNEVLSNLSTTTTLDFANGLTGIGWGVEYLIQNKLQRGIGADICAAIDEKLMLQDLLRTTDLSLDTGLEGWLHYILAHLQGARLQGRQVFDDAYLQDGIHLCRHILQQGSSPSLHTLCQTLLDFAGGGSVRYTFDLSTFILPTIKRNTATLGMRSGLAGHLYNQTLRTAV